MELPQEENLPWDIFYGFKLHIIVNEIGQIIDFQITQGNIDDRSPLKKIF